MSRCRSFAAPPAAEPRVVRSSPAQARMLALQRAAGNRVARRVLARYEAGEHSQLSTSTGTVTIGGVSGIEERYLIAMRDFYEFPDQLLEAKDDELRELLALIKRDEQALTGLGGKKPSEDEWQTWSERWRPENQRYMDLNKRNEAHFAPKNKREWERLHTQALWMALHDGNGTGVVSERARIYNAFAAHYLTDAFAAGHQIDKKAVMEKARPSLRAGTNRINLAWAVAKGVLADATCVAKLAGKEIKDEAFPGFGTWGPPEEERMARLLNSIFYWKESECLSVFALLAHNELNAAIGQVDGQGVWVHNKAGDRWQLSGDKTLRFSDRTRDIARKAVTTAERNLAEVAAIKRPLWNWPAGLDRATLDRMLADVWQYVPSLTPSALSGEWQSGMGRVAEVVEKFADVSRAETKAGVTAIAIQEFDTTMKELRANHLVRDKDPVPPTPPTPETPPPTPETPPPTPETPPPTPDRPPPTPDRPPPTPDRPPPTPDRPPPTPDRPPPTPDRPPPKPPREPPVGPKQQLTSPRFMSDDGRTPDPVLEACFEDRARLRTGSPPEPVRKVQQALIDIEPGRYDLGPSGADGIYGSRTAAAVKKFKRDEGLGSEQYGDVGPGTINRLDDMYPPE